MAGAAPGGTSHVTTDETTGLKKILLKSPSVSLACHPLHACCILRGVVKLDESRAGLFC